MNSRNFGVVVGRLVREPKRVTNKDNSQKVFVNVAVPRNFGKKDANNNYPSDFIGLQGFIPADKAGAKTVYDYMEKGCLVSISYSMRSQQYTGEDGKTKYSQYLQIGTVELMSKASKKTTEQASQTTESNQVQEAVQGNDDGYETFIDDSDLSEFSYVLSDDDVPF